MTAVLDIKTATTGTNVSARLGSEELRAGAATVPRETLMVMVQVQEIDRWLQTTRSKRNSDQIKGDHVALDAKTSRPVSPVRTMRH